MMIKIKYLFFVGFLLLSFSCHTGNQKVKSDSIDDSVLDSLMYKPVFETTEHNFGQLDRGEEVGARFGFKNEGHQPLIIERVSTGCGCTVAEYSKKPVKVDEKGFVEVVFDSRGKRGSQIQEAKVYFQNIEKPINLTIIAQVDKN
jgi:hypothetical protein